MIPTSVSRCVRRSPAGTGTWLGTTSTWQPAAAAEVAPVGESSIATVSGGREADQLGGAEVGLRVRLSVGDLVAADEHVEGSFR